MVKKKIPLRQCVVTKEILPKKHLLRIVRTKDRQVFLDLTGKISGKGAYIKASVEALQIAQKTKILNKVLEIEVPQTIYEQLKDYCK